MEKMGKRRTRGTGDISNSRDISLNDWENSLRSRIEAMQSPGGQKAADQALFGVNASRALRDNYSSGKTERKYP